MNETFALRSAKLATGEKPKDLAAKASLASVKNAFAKPHPDGIDLSGCELDIASVQALSKLLTIGSEPKELQRLNLARCALGAEGSVPLFTSLGG
jgi:hypothetical protein